MCSSFLIEARFYLTDTEKLVSNQSEIRGFTVYQSLLELKDPARLYVQ